MIKAEFPLPKVYGLLEPGPVLLLTTATKERPNVMALSWHTMIEFEPPLVGCVLSNRDFSFEVLRQRRECVLNIPTAEMAQAVVACGNHSGRDVDKFAAFGLTAVPASRVAPPLIAECYASLECRVVDTRLVNRYGFFVLEVLAAWGDATNASPRTLHHCGYGRFRVAGETLTLPSSMK